MVGANRTKESLYWYRTLSALRPADFVFYVNFEYVGMSREAEPHEIDKYRLVELGRFSRDELENRIRGGVLV